MRLLDIAKRARVSVSTVSRVVNAQEAVKPSTRKRVMAALEEMHYYPNLQARSLVAGRSKTLGLIVSNLENPFYVDIFHILEQDALEHGYEVLVANTNFDPARLERSIRLFLGRRVAGLAIVVSEQVPSESKELTRAEIPIAFLDAALPRKSLNMTTVRFDYQKGMSSLTEHLYSLGHRRMAYIGHPLHLGPTDQRKDAFIETATRLKIKFDHVTVIEKDGFPGGRDAVRELRRSGADVTAILCVNDTTAIGVLRELRNLDIPVPQRVSVTGFDNIAMSAFSCPSLTTINIPRERIAHTIFRNLLAESSKTSGHPNELIIDPELIVRESSGPASTTGGLLLAEIK